MKPCNLAVLTATVLVVTSSQAGAAGTLESAISNCTTQTDDKLRLACYDQVAAQLKAAAIQSPSQVAASPSPATPAAAPGQAAPQNQSAWYDVGSWFRSDSTRQQTTPAEFGSEHLPPPAAAAPPPAQVAVAPAPAVRATSPAPTASQPRREQSSAWYDVGGWFGSSTPKPPQSQTTVADFGSENLPPPPPAPGTPAAPQPLDDITAVVADVALNAYGRFILTLDNGQMWKQLEGDTSLAHFRKHGGDRITISRGLLGCYNLTIEGSNFLFKVRRIR